jgi:hypothetical protein
MLKNKKLHALLVAVLVAVFALGSIGVGVFASRVNTELQTSLFSYKKLKGKRGAAASRLIAKLIIPEVVQHALNVCLYAPPEKPEYGAEIVTAENKVWADSGGEFEVSVYVKNTGNTSWFSDASGCQGVQKMRLGTAKERDRTSVFYNPGDPRWLEQNRIAMVEHRVDPGEIATFSFKSHAPSVIDIFREYFQPVIEGVSWLDKKQSTARVDIYVGETSGALEQQLFYIGKSGQASSIDLNGEPAIYIDISEQKLRLKFGEHIVREYSVSTGTFRTPTPLGTFKILNKQELRIGGAAPHYRMPYWQGVTKGGVGLHALPYLANDKGMFWNEALNHIGQRASHGCIRLLPEEAEELFQFTDVELPVIIHA